jgi:hypothetical protein
VVAASLLLLVALAAARPAVLRPGTVVEDGRQAGVRLPDQREVAAAVDRWVGERPLVLLQSQELLYLMRRTSRMPVLNWNHGAWLYFREPGEESGEATLQRLLEEADLGVLAYPRRHVSRIPYLEEFEPRRFRSRSGTYTVRLLER